MGLLHLKCWGQPSKPNTLDAMRGNPHCISVFGHFESQKFTEKTIDAKRGFEAM